MLGRLINLLLQQFGYRLSKIDRGAPNHLQDLLSELDLGLKPLVLDVGANTGQTIDAVRSVYPDARVHSFEPDPDLSLLLDDKYTHEVGIDIHPIALSNSIGKARFYRNVRSDLNSLFQLRASSVGRFGRAKDVINVQTLTGDDFLETAGIDDIGLLKVDVQGAELQVFEGFSSAIDQGRFAWIVVEVSFDGPYVEAQSFNQLQALLSNRYQMYTAFGLTYNKSYALNQCDLVYKRIKDTNAHSA